MKLQASDASAPEGLQSQNLSRPENRLSVNGLAIVHGRLVTMFEAFNVGLDTGTPVDDTDYQEPFRFTGKINKLTVKLGPEQLTKNDREVIHALFASLQ